MKRKTPAEIRIRLLESVRRQAELLGQFEELLEDALSTSAELERLQRQLTRKSTEHTKLLSELRLSRLETAGRHGAYGGLAGQRPLREELLDVLDEIGVPSPARAIGDFAQALTGRPIDTARFASLRRDEERAYRKDPLSRPAWVVPAINVLGLTAIPRMLTSSAWEPEQRLIGARTQRTNHLRTLLVLLERSARAEQGDNPQGASQLQALVLRYAESVPNALEPGGRPSTERIREAAESELRRIAPGDLDERRAAARRLVELPRAYQLWGQPAVLDGGAAADRGARQ